MSVQGREEDGEGVIWIVLVLVLVLGVAGTWCLRRGYKGAGKHYQSLQASD